MCDLQRTKQNQCSSLNRFSVSSYTKNAAQDQPELDRYIELAKLSQGSKWVLLTNECPKLRSSFLKHFRINTKHLIQMMPSRKMTEKEVVLKALQSGNANAVIASKNISFIDQQHLLQRAKQLNCTLYFTDHTSKLFSVDGSLMH